MKIIEVTPQNAIEETFFCIKNTKSKEFKNKLEWFKNAYARGTRIKFLKNDENKTLGVIEYVLDAANAWRPINADGYCFVQCLYIYSKSDKNRGYGSKLIQACQEDAIQNDMKGVCVMVGDGSWIASKKVFEKNGYLQCDELDDFELFYKSFRNDEDLPSFVNWVDNRSNYHGWNALYSDQCPWNEKSIHSIQEICNDLNVPLKVTKIETIEEAKQAPSGFGTFALLHNDKLLSYHYLSPRRFMTIIEKELEREN